jgi:hypothetical protein
VHCQLASIIPNAGEDTGSAREYERCNEPSLQYEAEVRSVGGDWAKSLALRSEARTYVSKEKMLASVDNLPREIDVRKEQSQLSVHA